MIKIDVYELPEHKDGEFKHHVEYREYPEEGNRHSDLCVVCGFPSYPKCREWCPHQGYGKVKDDPLPDEIEAIKEAKADTDETVSHENIDWE